MLHVSPGKTKHKFLSYPLPPLAVRLVACCAAFWMQQRTVPDIELWPVVSPSTPDPSVLDAVFSCSSSSFSAVSFRGTANATVHKFRPTNSICVTHAAMANANVNANTNAFANATVSVEWNVDLGHPCCSSFLMPAEFYFKSDFFACAACVFMLQHLTPTLTPPPSSKLHTRFSRNQRLICHRAVAVVPSPATLTCGYCGWHARIIRLRCLPSACSVCGCCCCQWWIAFFAQIQGWQLSRVDFACHPWRIYLLCTNKYRKRKLQKYQRVSTLSLICTQMQMHVHIYAIVYIVN